MTSMSAGRLLVLGGLCGVAMTAMESFDAPLEGMRFDQLLSFVLLIGGHYVVSAVALSFGCAWLEPRLTWLQLALSLIAFNVIEAAAHTAVILLAYRTGAATGMQALFVEPRSLTTVFFYDLWPLCFYGGLFVVATTFGARAERGRARLGQMQVAADYADAQADQARAVALNAGLQPSFLLEATTRLEQLYEADPAGAAHLMTELVAFLRAAGVSDRSPVSSLGEELALVESYARVRARLGRPEGLSVVIEGPVPDLRFPGAVLLPVIDRLLSVGAAGVALRGAVLSVGGAPGDIAFCAATEAHIRHAASLGGGHDVVRRVAGDMTWLDVHLAGAPAPPLTRNAFSQGDFYARRIH